MDKKQRQEMLTDTGQAEEPVTEPFSSKTPVNQSLRSDDTPHEDLHDRGDQGGVRAQEGESVGESKGGEGAGRRGRGGKVRLAVEALERNYFPIKKPRFVKPYGKRGVKKDGLIQTQIASLVGGGKSDNFQILGLVQAGVIRKRNEQADNPGDVPVASLAKD